MRALRRAGSFGRVARGSRTRRFRVERGACERRSAELESTTAERGAHRGRDRSGDLGALRGPPAARRRASGPPHWSTACARAAMSNSRRCSSTSSRRRRTSGGVSTVGGSWSSEGHVRRCGAGQPRAGGHRRRRSRTPMARSWPRSLKGSARPRTTSPNTRLRSKDSRRRRNSVRRVSTCCRTPCS